MLYPVGGAIGPLSLSYNAFEGEANPQRERIQRKVREIKREALTDPEVANRLREVERYLQMGNDFLAEQALKEAERRAKENDDKKPGPDYEDAPLSPEVPSEGQPPPIGQQEKDDKITFVDRSGDPSVSFKYPTPVDKDVAEYMVAFHEGQHVWKNLSEAILNGENIYVWVVIRRRLNPQTGEYEVVGGTTYVRKFPKYVNAVEKYLERLYQKYTHLKPIHRPRVDLWA